MSESEIRQVAELIADARPVFAGRPAAIQGGALADLTAMWLAGHVMSGDRAGTIKLRQEILANHITMIRKLIEINERMMGTLT